MSERAIEVVKNLARGRYPIADYEAREVVRAVLRATEADREAEADRLRDECNIWKGRAFAMFWRLPGDTNIGDLQEESKRALAFVETK